VERHAPELAGKPVWFFSSGPVGDADPEKLINQDELAELVAMAEARDHRIFAGKLDRSALGIGERMVTRLVRAPEGDYRDWSAVRAWADEIAQSLRLAAVGD
jgi:menaquinone-dependent protoporphyrinogen oxidase